LYDWPVHAERLVWVFLSEIVEINIASNGGTFAAHKDIFFVPFRASEFFSVFMSGDKFVSFSPKHCGCVSSSFGIKKVVRESQWIGGYGKPYISNWSTAQLGAVL
jgi:hypothetical protein